MQIAIILFSRLIFLFDQIIADFSQVSHQRVTFSWMVLLIEQSLAFEKTPFFQFHHDKFSIQRFPFNMMLLGFRDVFLIIFIARSCWLVFVHKIEFELFGFEEFFLSVSNSAISSSRFLIQAVFYWNWSSKLKNSTFNKWASLALWNKRNKYCLGFDFQKGQFIRLVIIFQSFHFVPEKGS